jgi:hypothetical protein
MGGPGGPPPGTFGGGFGGPRRSEGCCAGAATCCGPALLFAGPGLLLMAARHPVRAGRRLRAEMDAARAVDRND